MKLQFCGEESFGLLLVEEEHSQSTRGKGELRRKSLCPRPPPHHHLLSGYLLWPNSERAAGQPKAS